MPARKAASRAVPSSSLLFADTRRSADALYIGGFSVPDPFIAFSQGRKWIAVLNQLEFARALKESRFDVVLPLEDCIAAARKRFGAKAGYAEVIAFLAAERGIARFRAPGDFPSGLAFKLVELGLEIDPAEGSLFPSRETKSEAEIAHIREGNRCSAAGIRAAEKALSESAIKRGKLYLGAKPLTSERLREVIEIACLQVGSVSMDTIAAGGDQACDPHCVGSGPLRANELIIVDVFPRVSKTGYYGDMTRTFLKGEASDGQRALVAAVRKAQGAALDQIKAGIDASKVHQRVVDTFKELGYETRRDAGGAVGFIHGTGHGLGLEIHEAPRVSTAKVRLKKNTVVTVEPGLYYPGLGGCRIEDVVAVRASGYDKISAYPYKWEIK